MMLSSMVLGQEAIEETQCTCGNGVKEAFPPSVTPCKYRLYGATAAGPTGISNLIYLNSYDGTGGIIAPISSNIRSVNGLDFSPSGVLYAAGRNTAGTAAVLATIDCVTGAATIIGTINSPQPAITDINFDSDGKLWAHVTGTPVLIRQDGILGTINIATAAFTFIGNTGRNHIGNGLGFEDFPDNVLYLADNLDLSTLDLMTGLATVVDPLQFSDPAHNRPRINGMDYDVERNVMYVSINDRSPGSSSPNEDYLGTIDLNDGVVSFVKVPPSVNPGEGGIAAVTVNRAYEACDQDGIDDPPLPDGTSCSVECQLLESNCEDEIDNDFDGLADCSDPDCEGQICEENPCTSGDICVAGVCELGTPIDCDDFNDCTDDSCNDGICVNEIDESNSCDDFNPCTGPTDVCDSSGFCAGPNLTDGTPCDDESVCTDPDSCFEGQCIGERLPEDCNVPGDQDCDGFEDVDDPDCATPVTIEVECNDGFDNDGDFLFDCEDPDCEGLECDDGNSCTDDMCIFGSCEGSPDDTNICDDADACTENDACSAGSCTGTLIVCNDFEECTFDFCADGSCSFSPLTGPACTPDSNACTDSTCSNGVCVHTNDNTNTCSDGLDCTSGDHCVSGSCTGTPGTETGTVKCSNGIDDDCDFLIDNYDPNCSSNWLRVFITKNTYSANFGSAAAADALCQSSATAASRTGTFKAFVSSSTSNASSRILNSTGRPWYMYSSISARIADNLADLLDGTIQQAINVDEFGAYVDNPKFAWTGSTTSGTVVANNTCNNWTTTQANVKGTRGASDKIDYQWVNQPDATCNQNYRLYCFQIAP